MTKTQLIDAFGDDHGLQAWRLISGTGDWQGHPAVLRWVAQCHHDPRRTPAAKPECVLVALNDVLKGSGVEAIHGRWVDSYHQDIQACYVNMGETYATTILYDHETGRYRLTSYGDWVETHTRGRELQ